jgi:FMN phosphatase YigB (HAD superfamily)
VLVVSGGGFQGLTAIAALREIPGVRIVVADAFEHPLAEGLANECVQVPPISAGAAFVDALIALCEERELSVVLPCTAHELMVLANARQRIESHGWRVAVSDPVLLERLLDKRACHEVLREAEVPVLEEVDPEAPEAPYPLVAKPRWSWGGRGQTLLASRDDWQAQARQGMTSSGYVFQAWLDGWDEVSVDFAIDFEGRPSPPTARRRLRVSGGFAVACQTDDDPRVLAAAERFALHVARRGGCGAFNLQLLRQQQQLRVIDVNPRLGTSATHWTGSGVNLLRHLLRLERPGLSPVAPMPGVHRRSVRRLTDTVVDIDPAHDAAEAGLRGFAFDLDDTLIPHKRWILARLDALVTTDPLAARIGRERLLAEGLRLLEEGHAASLFDALQRTLGLTAEEHIALIEGYRGSLPQHCDTYDDVAAALATLRRRGYRLAVLSDNPPEGQRRKLRAAGIESCFDAVVFSRDVGAEKPAAAGFRAVETALGLCASEVGMVGNNPYRDVAGALSCEWGFAYLVRRPGTMYAFDHELYRRSLGPAPRMRVVDTLSELLPSSGQRHG